MPSIFIVGEYWTDDDVRFGEPLSGTYGHVLRSVLSQAGIETQDYEKTCVFNFRPPAGDVAKLCGGRAEAAPGLPPLDKGKYLLAEHLHHVMALHRRIGDVKPNIIVALGNTALWATTGKLGIKKWRGSPLPSSFGQFKVIASWGLSSLMKDWSLRPILFMDLCKAKKESATPILVRPKRLITLAPSLEDMRDFYQKYIIPAPFVAVDVETKNNQITEVGIATSPSRCLVIPFWSRAKGNYWPTLESELLAWAFVRKVMREKKTVGQNFQYDMQYFYRTVGIPVPQFAGDTMLLHHSLQPEMQKGLGFLGSVYTDEPSWKFMRTDHSTLKREDD